MTHISDLNDLQEKTIYLPGYIDGRQKLNLLGSAKLHLFATQETLFKEGHSIVLFETMAAKSPLIASSTELHRYFKSIGAQMDLVKSDDVDAWTNRIEALLNTKDSGIDHITRSNFEFIKKFGWVDIAKQYKGVYENVLDHKVSKTVGKNSML